MNATIKKTYDFVASVHESETSGHDLRHIERVHDMCLYLQSDLLLVDSEILQMAALLHDVDDYKISSPDKDRTGAFLRSLSFDEQAIQKIKHIISCSSFSNNMGKDTSNIPPEAKILSDADKLDAMGAEGIIRTITYGNKVGQPVFLPACMPRKNLTVAEYRSDERKDAHSIAHFFDKLLKLKDMMFTDKAKAVAKQRHDFMLLFLREFFTEENAPDAWYDLLKEYE